ncbi:MAG: glycosyltransferase [Bacteroidales bacterium]|nr:glycosyltransferase [Bacteroidales bacterium]
MKDLYFFTFSYPYSHDFSWKGNELSELQKYFRVTIIPYVNQKSNALTNVPEGVKFNSPAFENKILGKWSQLFKTILTPRIFYYYRDFFRKKVFRKKIWTLEWIAAVTRTEKLLRNPAIKQFLKKENKNKDSVLYFYWGVGSTLIIPFLRKLGYNKIIARFHGFDLYEDRKEGYIPFRTDLLKNIDQAILISDHGDRYLHNAYPNIGFNSKVFRLGSKKRGESNPSNDNKLRIVSCSNIIPLKRVHLIADALKYIDFELEWIHFGDGELFEDLKILVKTIHSNIKVNLTGRKAPSEVLEYYSNNCIDLFINVSTTEGVPVSIMEAFSAGIPVYATGVGGTPEIVNDKNGKLLDKKITSSELAKEIKEFYHLDRDKKINFRKTALETYKNKCDFNILNEKFIKFLKDNSV